MAGGADCPICDGGGPRDVIVTLDASWVSAPRRAPLPGYLCVVGRPHVVEPFELDGLERRRYWDEVMVVARAARDATGASKMNYEIHGNTIPHLHTHLYPRFSGDPFTGRPIDGAATLFERTPDQIARLAAAIEHGASAPASNDATPLEPPAVYDRMAAWFDAQSASGFYNAHYERPAVLALVGDVADQRVLDAGCGPGHLLVALLERGARVTGIDGSAALLRRARARAGGAVELVQHDLNQPLSMFEEQSFDGAVLGLTYHHVDQRAGLLAELRRILKPRGWLVLSTSHPVADWLQSGGSYFALERVEALFDRRGGRWPVAYWRMSMTTLLEEILGAGFALERLLEPVPPAESRDVDPRIHARLGREPAFLVLKVRRPAACDE